MNPIKNTLLIFLACIVITIFLFFTIKDFPGTETHLAVLVYSLYLTPLACIIGFVISCLFQRDWIRENLMTTIVFSAMLLLCFFLILYSYYQ